MKADPGVLEQLERHNRFLLVTHKDPDGDGICALLGAHKLLCGLDKEPVMYTPKPPPRRFRDLPTAGLIKTGRLIESGFDCLLVLDTPTRERIGLPRRAPDGFIINIDHHPSNEQFGDLNWVEAGASSACELMYQLFCRAKLGFDPESALILYTGIYLETGGFSYPNTTPQSFIAAGALLRYGVEPAEVARRFSSLNLSQLKLLARVVSRVELKDGIAVIRLPRRLRDGLARGEELNADGFMRLPLFLEGVKVVIFLREERKGLVRVSFRSPGAVDVNRLASRFGGGGHQTAAGAKIHKPLSQVSREVLRATQEYLGSGGS